MTDRDEVERLEFYAGRWDVFSKRERGPTFSRGDCREWRDRFQEAADHLAEVERERDARVAHAYEEAAKTIKDVLTNRTPAYTEARDLRNILPTFITDLARPEETDALSERDARIRAEAIEIVRQTVWDALGGSQEAERLCDAIDAAIREDKT